MDRPMIRLISAIGAAVVLTFAAAPASAVYPEKRVTFLVGFAPGGGTDLMARLMAAKLTEKWGQAVVVENKPGADGTIAAEQVARAPADGYTLLFITPNHVTTPSMRNLGYDPLKDFAPVIRMTTIPNVLVVNPAVLPVNSAREFVAAAKAKPGAFNYASTGPGGPGFMAMNILMQQTGIEMTNLPFGSSGQGLIALLGGQVHVMFTSPPELLGHIKEGRLRALGISTRVRIPVLPDVPTVEEAAGLNGFEVGVWYGIIARAATPKDIVDKVNKDVAEILNSADMKQRLTNQGFVTVGDSPADFAEFMKAELDRSAAILGKLGLKKN